MTYGPEEASLDLTSVGDGSVSFEARARLEHFLLSTLRERGDEAVAALLRSLPGHNFKQLGGGVAEHQVRYLSAVPGTPGILVATFSGPISASVNVTSGDELKEPPTPDPRHQAFYEMWESMLGPPDADVAQLDPTRRAVLLVGLLEAEVMNGGLGQYLANTNGVHLEDTVQCLASIGAERTRAIVVEAGKLGKEAGSFSAAWESRAQDLERLDDEFLASGEDLAGLTVDAFFEGSAGRGLHE
jgi:hypothetical protein